MKQFLLVAIALLGLSGCGSWVYKYDIAQGNFLNQDDVDKLRVEMTKEQVEYVLGSPVIQNPFKSDQWHYIFTNKSGVTDKMSRIELIVRFENGKLVEVSGDFEQPKEFNIPLDAR